MIRVPVSASRDYDILIEQGLLDQLGPRVRAVCPKAITAVIVSGDRVAPLYGERVERSLREAGLRVESFTYPHGEQSKTLETYGALIRFLSEKRLTRSDVLIALGGGVTGDLTGFAAATYQRGIDYIQVPTTLLAMVDSSVGGKTAVDLPTGKNQVGCFYQPAAVLCDPDTLDTLPEEEFRCGCAEVIKYGVLCDPVFFDELNSRPIRQQLEHVICRCVECKRDIVHEDEYDRGLRQLLNLGHTFGHAVEACSEYKVLHGQAVAIGMAMITRAAVAKGYCGTDTLDQLLGILRKYGLPTETSYPLRDLVDATASDKKLAGETLHLIVPEKIGRCRIVPIPLTEISDWLRLGGVQ